MKQDAVTSFASERAMRQIESGPLPANLGSVLTQAAAQYPNRPIANFFDDGVTITYETLDRHTNSLAHSLAERGVKFGTHVGLMLRTGVHYPIAWLALAKLGAITVPINTSYTARELAFVLDDSDAEYLIIQDEYVPIFEQDETKFFPRERVIVAGERLDRYQNWDDLLRCGSSEFRSSRSPTLDDPINIQYTSGTTGLPKGAIVPHGAWVLRGKVWEVQLHYPVQRILSAAPLYYADGQSFLTLAMTLGATAFIPAKQSASRFLDWVAKYDIEFCNLPEIVARTLDETMRSRFKLKITYGYSHRKETYPDTEKFLGCPVRQGYAMTEIGATIYVPAEADFMTGSGTVGIPSAFREVKITDEKGEIAPPGTIGEIRVRGRYLFKGYYKRAEANAHAFDADGWFRTGDLGVMDEQGWFYFLGRLKDMVRRSNENISALEVENVLSGVPGIAEAAVLPVPDEKRGEEVKAYIKLAEGHSVAEVPPEVVLEHCRKNLAKFKIPRYIEYVHDFPRTPSNKIKKMALIEMKSDLRSGAFDTVHNSWHD